MQRLTLNSFQLFRFKSNCLFSTFSPFYKPVDLFNLTIGQITNSLKPPILILHGLLGSSTNLRSIALNLNRESNWNSILIDARCHGQSPHTKSIKVPEMVEDIKNLLNNKNISKINLIGHSMGGKVAMSFALQEPQMVDKLIVVDISPIAYSNFDEVANLIKNMLNIDLNQVKSYSDADKLLSQTIEETKLRSFLLKNLRSNNDNSTFYWQIPLQVLLDNLNDLRDYSCSEFEQSQTQFKGKVLFIRGELSNYVKVEQHLPTILKLFPNATIHTIQSSGHWPHADNPQQFSQIVNQFLSN
eukprot:TRINITY_DN4081_c0_g5_i1.p1 TRINITY_DN4081_c0_g5~~TRINITY_DN4081_c0_g5_i1.p1  ORF type:complete len:300 (-),score=120.42 TRINITY_DN4081_c0_g5_i1:27-926(-)